MPNGPSLTIKTQNMSGSSLGSFETEMARKDVSHQEMPVGGSDTEDNNRNGQSGKSVLSALQQIPTSN